jgi:hypothetical protein
VEAKQGGHFLNAETRRRGEIAEKKQKQTTRENTEEAEIKVAVAMVISQRLEPIPDCSGGSVDLDCGRMPPRYFAAFSSFVVIDSAGGAI